MKSEKNDLNYSEIYSSFLEMSVEGILVIDKNKIIRTDNPGAKKILGYSKNELENKSILDIIPPDHQPEFNNLCQTFLKSGEVVSGVKTVIPFLKKDKEEILTEISLGNHIHSKEGPLMIVLFSDISEKTEKELELKRSEEVFSKAFHLSPAPSAITRLSDGRYKDVNTSFLISFGYERQEVLGRTSIELDLYRHCGENARKQITEALKNNGLIRDLELTLNKSTGEPIEVLFSAETIQLNGEDHILSTMIDVTEKKKAEEVLRKFNEALEQKVIERTIKLTESLKREKEINDMKSRFVTMASHEFRTPLAAILSSSSLLEMHTNVQKSEKLSKHFNRIKSSVAHLTQILSDFILLEDIENGNGKIINKKFLLNTLIKDVYEEIKIKLKNDQEINYLPFEADIELFQDETKIRYVLTNLLSNAIKYSTASKDNKIMLTTELKNGYVIITIKDYGIGIPDKDQKNIFSLFFRATNSQIIEGTGLGLNITKKYMELIGGKISFTSIENKETCFTISFPSKANAPKN